MVGEAPRRMFASQYLKSDGLSGNFIFDDPHEALTSEPWLLTSHHRRRDESDQYSKLPSYTVFNLHTSYRVTKTVQLYGKVDNIDTRYATYGQFFDTDALPNLTNGGNNCARSAGQGRLRSMRAYG